MKINHIFTETKRMRRALVLLCGLAMMICALLLLGLQAAKPAHAATTFTVNSTGDAADENPGNGTCQTAPPGECTLRAAIQESNSFADADTINFAIPGNVSHTISPASDLPLITKPMTIDGYTQSGATPNTLTEPDKTNAVLMIQLSGGYGGLFLTDGASNSVIRGLAIGGCLGANNACTTAISLSGGKGYKVEGNFIGIDTAAHFLPNLHGVHLTDGASGSTIGGTTPDKHNLIEANSYEGVLVSSNSSGNTIEGNCIANNPIINFGTGGSGVVLELAGSTGNRILSNSIFSNLLLGIDLGNNGPTANDDKDPDVGPNNLQNYPLITSAQAIGN
jgi:trimeric autotransporter adhesin